LIMCDTIKRSPSLFMNVAVWKCALNRFFKVAKLTTLTTQNVLSV